jgi:hypothetical protein
MIDFISLKGIGHGCRREHSELPQISHLLVRLTVQILSGIRSPAHPKCRIIQEKAAIQAVKVRIGVTRFWRACVIFALRLFPGSRPKM